MHSAKGTWAVHAAVASTLIGRIVRPSKQVPLPMTGPIIKSLKSSLARCANPAVSLADEDLPRVCTAGRMLNFLGSGCEYARVSSGGMGGERSGESGGDTSLALA